MKKRFKIITIAVIVLILGIVILFCSKINKILLIENIKQKIAKTEEIQTTDEVTTIDVTDLEIGKDFNHTCILFTKYNENEHWQECKLCGKKQNIEKHNYIDGGWTMGNTCNPLNVHKFNCECGHAYETQDGKPSCNYYRYNWNTTYVGGWICSVCSVASGDLHKCKKNDGSDINCLNLGTCAICGYTYNGSNSYHVACCYNFEGITEGEMRCQICNLYLGKANYSYIERVSDTMYKYYCSLTIPSNCQYNFVTTWSDISNNITISPNISNNGYTYNGIFTITFNKHTETKSYLQVNFTGKINGMNTNVIFDSEYALKADSVPPTITEISKGSLTEWSQNKPIVISGTENYCNTITAKIVEADNEENIIFEGQATVINGKYSISCTPDNIEVGISGKSFKCIITDNCDNSTEEIFEIAKVDSVPPNPTSEDSLSNEWAREKKFTFSAIDYGIGDVQIAFNDENEYGETISNENNFTREYKFVGDVYEPKQAIVLYKDGLGNVSSKEITLNRIDNTAPTIISAELHNNKITVTSHDEHETIGEGSGVVKYRYLASEEKLENPVLTKENSIEVNKIEEIKIKEIYKKKYVYAVAEDYVGNVSEVYEFKVPELKLTATANPNTANGKGEIILDWSSYDVTDKYFVIYRKKENQEEWETIVSLTQKLTGNTYTDTLANDEADPNTPNITITSNATNNNINITPTATDNGSTYTYYIEAYDSTGTLLSKSN